MPNVQTAKQNMQPWFWPACQRGKKALALLPVGRNRILMCRCSLGEYGITLEVVL